MASHAFELYGHIRRNTVRSRLLIAGLFACVYALTFGILLVVSGDFAGAMTGLAVLSPFVMLATALWVMIGFRYNVGIIGRMTGSRETVPETDQPLHRALETLCISRGLRTPKLAVIDTPALNAFASGTNEEQYTVTVTSGLMAALDDREMRAVLAHELTHIRNGDVRLMIVATLIAGVLSIVGEIALRGAPRSGGAKKGSGLMILAGLALIVLAWFGSRLIRYALSRSREFLADAGAVELTKDPDAMISALMKIEGRSKIEGAPEAVMDMCFENEGGKFDPFSTHPTIQSRIQALIETAGGRLPANLAPAIGGSPAADPAPAS